MGYLFSEHETHASQDELQRHTSSLPFCIRWAICIGTLMGAFNRSFQELSNGIQHAYVPLESIELVIGGGDRLTCSVTGP